jgi:hypothetical protein
MLAWSECELSLPLEMFVVNDLLILGNNEKGRLKLESARFGSCEYCAAEKDGDVTVMCIDVHEDSVDDARRQFRGQQKGLGRDLRWRVNSREIN